MTSTVTPASRSSTAPPPGTKMGGSSQAMTTRPAPLAMISSAHGVGREEWTAHGSSELYIVAPRSSGRPPPAAALASATSSAWSAGSVSLENPVASKFPSAVISTAPTENAVGEGTHRPARSTASASQCRSGSGDAGWATRRSWRLAGEAT